MNMNAFSVMRNVIERQKQGKPKGMYSVCSSNPYVIEASLKQAEKDQNVVLIESTSNQVNQFGGYTGMNPFQFRDFVYSLAEKWGLEKDRIILGGDHLGPNPFQIEDSQTAIEKACVMIDQFVSAGFTKIHLDTSMPLGDDPGKNQGIIEPKIVADRCARLCAVSEDAYKKLKAENSQAEPPFYVIGTEVPVPGCATGANHAFDIEMAVRFVVEVAKAFGEGKCFFFDEKEFQRLLSLYGSLEHLKTLGNK